MDDVMRGGNARSAIGRPRTLPVRRNTAVPQCVVTDIGEYRVNGGTAGSGQCQCDGQ